MAILILVPLSANAQTDEERINDLRNQIEQLEAQASQYRSSIAGERAKAASLQQEISVLKKEILSLETQIVITDKKIGKTELEVKGVSNNITNTEANIVHQKEIIGRLVLFLDQRDSENLVSLLMKNDSFSEFFRQEQYAENISTQLVTLIGELKQIKEKLAADKTSLEQYQGQLEQLNQERESKKSSLAGVKSGRDTLLKSTKGQEAEYQRLLADVEKRKTEFFVQLQQFENKIIAGGLYIVRVVADKIPPKGTKLFKWPEDDYVITQGYGCTKYSKYCSPRGPYGTAGHNGIDMASGRGTPIKSIGDGEVLAAGTNDGFGNWVAVKHTNNMVSVYGHLNAFGSFLVGRAVKTGDVIGYEGSTGNSTGSHLHLSLYKEFFTYVNERKNQLYFNYFEGSINPADYL
mgnify:CR=1 FL=1